MTTGTISGISSNLLSIKPLGPVMQNEICFVETRGLKLMAEVIKVSRHLIFAQLFENSLFLRIGDTVEFTGHLLEAELGPGIISRNYDGLQNDLDLIPGLFIKPGEITASVNKSEIFEFTPFVKVGAKVVAGQWLGEVKELWIPHKIMLPFALEGVYEVMEAAPEGGYRPDETLFKVKSEKGNLLDVNMLQKWPVKKSLQSYKIKRSPTKIFHTGIRVIDSLNPIAEGGTGFIPGAFGTGKTVLQQAIAKNNDSDLVILVACGERANEVVDIFTHFPELEDLRTGRKLKDKTTIVCNTSNMPVAARETSVYLGMTLAEYYRNMGLKVLLLADSTSRWAQALREMSNRLEEMPGTDAFPVELPATISQFYSRAGEVELDNGEIGSITFLGTVSPAGGNFKEPVTESTGKVARCFYALSQKRADAKRYPAIDPLLSYSRYLDYPDFIEESRIKLADNWPDVVASARIYLQKGLEYREQISILGDDGVPIEYHIGFWKSELIDFVFVQQDSFDENDMNCPMERQVYMLEFILRICRINFDFEDYEKVSFFFKKLIDFCRQMNFHKFKSDGFYSYQNLAEELLSTVSTNTILP